MVGMASFSEFVAGWNCWVLRDKDYPEILTPSFRAGYEAARYENRERGDRPFTAQHDDSCEKHWKRYTNQVVEQKQPFPQTRHPVRYLVVYGNVFLRCEDVCALLAEFGASEETDVRNRVNKLIQNLKGA